MEKSSSNVVILVNSIPPYRIPLFNLINSKVGKFSVIFDKLVESDRDWNINSECFDFNPLGAGTLSYRRKKRSGAGTDFHFPILLYPKIAKIRPDHIISTELGFRTLVAIVYRILHRKVQLTLWLTLSQHTEKEYGQFRLLVRTFMLSRVDRILVASRSAKRYVETFSNRPEIVISHQSIHVSEERSYLPRHHRTPEFIFVSSTDPRKNITQAFQGLDSWAKRQNIKVRATVLGALPLDVNIEKYEFIEFNLEGFVQYTEVSKYYHMSDALVFASLLDEWGLVVNEALASSIPVIGSICAEAVNELIVEDENGWKFDPRIRGSFEKSLDAFYVAFLNHEKFQEIRKAAFRSIANRAQIEHLSNALISNRKQEDNDAEKLADAVLSLRYLNTYRVPLIEALYSALKRLNRDLITVGTLPSKEMLGNQDNAWHKSYRVLPEIKFFIGKKELRFRLFPLKLIMARVIVSEHAAGNLHNFALIIIRKALRKPTALIGHGSNITSKSNLISKYLETWQVRHCDWYFAYTEGSAERVRNSGVSNEIITVFLNSTDTNSLRNFLNLEVSKSNVTNGEWIALYIGSINHSKNTSSLIELCARIYSKDQRFRLIVCGEGDTNYAEIYSQYDFIRFVGYKSGQALAEVASCAQIILTLGRIGLVATDSFGLRIPIVGLDGQIKHAPEREYLNTENSRLVSSVNEVEMVVLELMNNSALLEKLKIGCDQSLDIYSIEKSANLILNGIHSIGFRDENG